jgi:hypothetical protein
MSEYPKKIHKELRRLAGIAYDRDMEKALSELESHFKRWHSGELSPHELNDLIHKHHDGIARNLWKFYKAPPDVTVPQSVADGTLREEEVTAELMDFIAERVAMFRNKES